MAVPPHGLPEYNRMIPHGADTALMFAARVGDARVGEAAGRGRRQRRTITTRGASARRRWRRLRDMARLRGMLLDKGADPNNDKPGFTALHCAIMRRDEATVAALLARGANPNAPVKVWTPTRRSSDDYHFMPALVDATPYWLAARFTQPGVMRLLAKHGADPKVIHESNYVQGEGYQRRKERTTAVMAALGMGGGTAWVPIDRAERDALILETVQAGRRAWRRCERGEHRRPHGPRLGPRAEIRRRRGIPRSARSRRLALARVLLGLHRGAEPLHRAVHRHPRAIDRIESEVLGDFRRRPLRLDARDDELALARLQAAHRRRDSARTPPRGSRVRAATARSDAKSSWKLDVGGAPDKPPHLVADPVDDRLPQVRLHRADVPRLERVEPRDGVHRGILDEIGRVEMAARGSRQTPMRPALERRQASLEDRFDRGLIAACARV